VRLSGRFSIVAVSVLGLLLALSFLPATFAVQSCSDDCTGLSLSANPGSTSPGSTVTISTGFNGSGPQSLGWVAVITPSGVSYLCSSASQDLCSAAFSPNSGGGSITCSIPYGGAGSVTATVSNGIANGPGASPPCDNGGSNPVWEQIVGSQTLTSLLNTCSAAGVGFPTTTGGLVDGNTTQSGTYTAAACWSPNVIEITVVGLVSNSFVITAASSTSSTSTTTTTTIGAPEFPMGSLFLIALAIPSIVLLKLFLNKGTRQP
jgi:hypothetical protein